MSNENQTTTYTKPEAHPLQAAFTGLVMRTTLHMTDSTFEAGTLAVYGKEIELLESSNDTTHEHSGIDGVVPPYYEDDLKKAIEDGDIECWRADLILNDLVRKGILPAGDYFIRVSW